MMKHLRLTRSQGEALTTLVGTMRKDWDLPGVRAAIRQAAEIGPAFDVIVATVRAAANTEARTPAFIPSPGPHWQGTATGSHQPPTMCGLHPEQRALRCPECATTPTATPEQIAAARQRARELAANPPQETP